MTALLLYLACSQTWWPNLHLEEEKTKLVAQRGGGDLPCQSILSSTLATPGLVNYKCVEFSLEYLVERLNILLLTYVILTYLLHGAESFSRS